MSETSLYDLVEGASEEYFDMGLDDPALQPAIADPGEYELKFKSHVVRTDKNGVGQVSAALEIQGDSDYETVWHRLGLPSSAYNNTANRIRLQEIFAFAEAFGIAGKTPREILKAIDEGEGKGNVTWGVLKQRSYTDDAGVTTISNEVDKFVTK